MAQIVEMLGKPDSEGDGEVGYVVATYGDGNACGLHRHAILLLETDSGGYVRSWKIRQD